MSRSETLTGSTEKEPRSSGGGLWRVVVSLPTLLGVAVVLIAEAALHLEPVRSALPESRIFYSNHVESRLEALRGTLREEGRVDVLFVGSSIVRTNFRPLLFDSVAGRHGDREPVSFNGGLSGLPPSGVHLYLEHFFLPRITPEHVFQGIRYPEVLRSEPATDVPPLRRGVVEPLWMDPSPVNRIGAWAWEHVSLLRHRGVLGRVLRARSRDGPSLRTYPIDSRGWNRRDSTVAERVARGAIAPLDIHPPPERRRALEGGLDHLRRTADLLRARGIEYTLVNVPEHGDRFASEEAHERYKAYIRTLRTFADERDVGFIDVTDGNPDRYRDDSWYYDGHHMTARGARRFTEEVAYRWLSGGSGPTGTTRGR